MVSNNNHVVVFVITLLSLLITFFIFHNLKSINETETKTAKNILFDFSNLETLRKKPAS